MTTAPANHRNAVDRVAQPSVALPARVGQATAIEQSRAVAEVQAAIVVAQQCPRSMQVALGEMEASCSQKYLAEKAFYRFPRAGGAVSGESVHLARELARCFGNVQYGVHELRRDDDAGQSEMQAWAWDVQLNTRASTTFIVPHVRDKKGGGERLTEMRDIYENNANMGARRLREMIFSILPTWFVEQAKTICTKTLEGDGSKPLAQRIADTVKFFEDLDVGRAQLERKLGRRADDWTARDIAQLGVTYRSLQRGEVTREEEFPDEIVTPDEIVKPVSAPPAQARPSTRNSAIRTASEVELATVASAFGAAGLTDPVGQLAYASDKLGRTVESLTLLSVKDATTLVEALKVEPSGGKS